MKKEEQPSLFIPPFSTPSLLMWKKHAVLVSGGSSPPQVTGGKAVRGGQIDHREGYGPQLCGQLALILSYTLPKVPSNTHGDHKPHKHPRTFQDLEEPQTPSWVRAMSPSVTHPWAPKGKHIGTYAPMYTHPNTSSHPQRHSWRWTLTTGRSTHGRSCSDSDTHSEAIASQHTQSETHKQTLQLHPT